jgi:hypothetical protein
LSPFLLVLFSVPPQIVAFGGRFEWAADPSYGDEGKTVAGEIAGSLDMSDIAKGSYFIGRLSNMDIKSLMQLVLPANVYKSFKLPEWLATCGFPGDMEMSYSFAATTTPTGMRALYFCCSPSDIRLVHYN